MNVHIVEVKDFFDQKRSALYKHPCGREYVRTAEARIPRERLIVCDQCLEPMPLCDQNRASYSYMASCELNKATDDAVACAGSRKTERPILKTSTRPRPLSQQMFQWRIATTRQPRRIAFASSTWV